MLSLLIVMETILIMSVANIIALVHLFGDGIKNMMVPNNVKVKITNSGVEKFTNFGETSSQ